MNQTYNLNEPIAFFLTWTTYGTWLPGDDRGWQRKGVGGVQKPDSLIQSMAIADLREEPFLMSLADRGVVNETIARHCDIRDWKLHAVNARTNHVHTVISAHDYSPNTVRDQLKAWCTRKLKETHLARERFWTEGASCRQINSDDGLESAIAYTLEAQEGDREHK